MLSTAPLSHHLHTRFQQPLHYSFWSCDGQKEKWPFPARTQWGWGGGGLWVIPLALQPYCSANGVCSVRPPGAVSQRDAYGFCWYSNPYNITAYVSTGLSFLQCLLSNSKGSTGDAVANDDLMLLALQLSDLAHHP